MHYKTPHQTRKIPFFFSIQIICLSFCLNLTIPVPAFAKDSTKSLVHKLWELNSGDKLLHAIKQSLLTGEENLVAGLEEKEAAKIKKIVDDNFVEIKQQMFAYMEKNGLESSLARARNWLDTPLGLKVTQMQLPSQYLFTDPETVFPAKVPELSKERATLLTKFERIAFAQTNTVNGKTMEHFIYLLNHTRPPDKRFSDAELNQAASLASVKIGSSTTEALPHIFANNYNALSLEELTVYLNFLDSEGGKSYTNLFVDAYVYALAETRPKALLQLSKLFEDELSVLSPYSKVVLDDKKQRELMALLIKRHGIQVIIRSMMDAGTGQMTIMKNGETEQVYGRPNHKLVTLDTLMIDLQRSGKDIRQFYQIVQNKLRYAN